MGLLDNEGLAHFWGKVRAALAGKQDTITAGDGLSKEGDILSVTTPVRGVVTQAEFDALPEERRNKGLYVIPGGEAGGGASPPGLGGIFRHMVIFQESGVFNPADYGLKAGDLVSVTVVGGGGGGGVPCFKEGSFPDGYVAFIGGDAGKGGGGSGEADGGGGSGYGAGGGASGAAYVDKKGGTAAGPVCGGGGGGSGFVVHAVVRLPSASPIPVPVGAPGKGGRCIGSSSGTPSYTTGTSGGASSFGPYVTAAGGEPGENGAYENQANGYGGNGQARGGDGGRGRNDEINSKHARGGRGGSNGSPGMDGERANKNSSNQRVIIGGGGGGGGYVIPFSALEVETIGELVPGQGVVVVYW